MLQNIGQRHIRRRQQRQDENVVDGDQVSL